MYPLSAADCGYTEGEQIAVDELRFTAWHTPGHTPGSVVLLCGEHLFCGDTLFAGSIGRTDLEGGSSAQMADSCASWHSCPSPAKHRCCPAMANFLPLARSWTTTTISAALCAAATTFFKERTT